MKKITLLLFLISINSNAQFLVRQLSIFSVNAETGGTGSLEVLDVDATNVIKNTLIDYELNTETYNNHGNRIFNLRSAKAAIGVGFPLINEEGSLVGIVAQFTRQFNIDEEIGYEGINNLIGGKIIVSIDKMGMNAGLSFKKSLNEDLRTWKLFGNLSPKENFLLEVESSLFEGTKEIDDSLFSRYQNSVAGIYVVGKSGLSLGGYVKFMITDSKDIEHGSFTYSGQNASGHFGLIFRLQPFVSK